MSINEVKKRAKELGLDPAKTSKKDELIRAIQAAEGNSQCFGTDAVKSCSQENCCWRPDCLEL
ncbi:MAG TPA: SAP domain-containing protein [Lentisphaeria bacterium]|nr:MAG: hypothetical protein A2X45_15005 [Lentisphaerae bacterium GWF2_50_93]HCE46999.1 SAP domain-containing protein [Lentisphaeria bacterium]